MDNEEFKKLCEELKAQGLEVKDILNVLYKIFLEGGVSKEDLGKMAGSLGYELSPEFLEEDAMTPMEALNSEEEIEDAKEYSEDEDSEDDEDEREEARKLMGLKD